jgi:hypothetical protein
MLGRSGAEVLLLTPAFAPMSPRLIANQDHTFIMQRLHAARVRLLPTTYIRSIGDTSVTTFDVYTNQEKVIDAIDSVVLATSRVPVNKLESQLEGRVSQLFTIGDALASRLFAHATFEAQKFARLIGEPAAPRSFAEAYFQPNLSEFTAGAADVGR